MASMIRHPEKLQTLLAEVRAFVRERWHPLENTVEQLDHVPDDIVEELRQRGFFGWSIPEAYGGLGLSTEELILAAFELSQASVALRARVGTNTGIGSEALVADGTDAQKQRWLPPLIAGTDRACFAVTEPNTGLNTLKLKTFARREGDHYVVHGQKVWISTAQVANKMLLLARTTPTEDCKGTEGLSLFYTDLDRSKVEVREIEKMGRTCVDSNQVFIDGLCIPVEDRVGEEGQGFSYILHGLNPERILIASEAVGLGRAALKRAASYANEREVFGRSIGQNQGIQHPLAKSWMELEAADLMVQKAAWLYDQNLPCAAEANSAKYLAAEACYHACENAIFTHGGMGYAKEYHVERYLRESWIPRLAPVSPQLILCFIAEKVLGLPKSY